MGNNLWFQRNNIINPIDFEIAGGKIVCKTYKNKQGLDFEPLESSWSILSGVWLSQEIIWYLGTLDNYAGLFPGDLVGLNSLIKLDSYGEINHCTVEDIELHQKLGFGRGNSSCEKKQRNALH